MKFKNGMIVHCDTREKAMRFLKECHKLGFKWSDGESTIDESVDYYFYGKDTVFYIKNSILTYGKKCNAPENGLISFDELIKTKEVKQLKLYQMPYFVHEDVEKVIVNEPCVIVFLRSGEKGIAKCCPNDKFEEIHGYSIAYQRATIQRIKNEMKYVEGILNYLTE